MIDQQSSGRRWGWPALALLSLAALAAGAWWLASARPESAAAFLSPGTSQPPPQPAHPARMQPHPASLGASAAQRRRLPLQTSAAPRRSGAQRLASAWGQAAGLLPGGTTVKGMPAQGEPLPQSGPALHSQLLALTSWSITWASRLPALT